MPIDRNYKQGMVTLSFPNNGPSVQFRINPDTVDWNFKVKTAVIDTIGGRVVQVLGADLSDMTVKGRFGAPAREGAFWRDAENFLSEMRQVAEHQASDATKQGHVMHQPAVFDFPAKGWRFEVYLKSITDGQGQFAIQHSSGKFSYDYILTFSIFNDLNNTSRIIGRNNGDIHRSGDIAVQQYIERIFDGIGWKVSEYNGPSATAGVVTDSTRGGDKKKKKKGDDPTDGGGNMRAPITKAPGGGVRGGNPITPG